MCGIGDAAYWKVSCFIWCVCGGGGGSSTIKGIILGLSDGLNVQDIGNFDRETCCKAAT